MTEKHLTLCVLHNNNRVLLGMKKRGFGMGKWNGFGGKVNSGETVEDAAKREMAEEAGIRLQDMHLCGKLDFVFTHKPDEVLKVHVFKATKFEGEPFETEEMRPAWYHVDDIPFHSMWADDQHWMHMLLADKKFKGKFLFEGGKIVEQDLNEVLEI